ncbi:MAG: hypothetical protein ACT4P6_21740 [Gemmatimonadaceae bacterium]
MSSRLVPVLVVALVLVAAIMSITPWPVGTIQDDATYVVLAKSLATGEGYRQLNLPGAPQVTHYPPGYPLLLAALWRLWPDFPDNLVVFKYANAVLLTLAALGAYAFARARAQLSTMGAGATAVAGTACVLVLYVTGIIVSEPLFMALMFPVLIVSEKATQDGKVTTAIAAAALGVALAMVRTIGIAVFPALLLALATRRHWKAACAAFVTGVCLLAPWQLWAAAHANDVPAVVIGKYGSYLGWMLKGYRDGGSSFGLEVINKNLVGLRELLEFLVMPVSWRWVRLPVFVGAVALTLYGLTRLSRRTPVTVLYALGYFAIVLVWPFEVHRFLMAGFPIVVLAFSVGAGELWRAQPQTRVRSLGRGALLASVFATVGGFLWYNIRGHRETWWVGVQRDSGERIGQVVRWVRSNTTPVDVIAVQDDPAVYLYTGRRAVPVNDSDAADHLRERALHKDLAKVSEILERYRPRFYIVAGSGTLAAADSLARVQPAIIRPVGRVGPATIFMNLIR